MQTLSNVQRNFYDKKYIKIFIEIFISFLLASLSSSFIYFPMLLGIVIMRFDKTKIFLFSFLLFTEITHGLFIFSLILFYCIFKEFILIFLKDKIENRFIPYLSIFLIYVLYFGVVWILYYLFNVPIIYDYSSIFIYYILLEMLILKLISL
jgi:hypothetical protein